MITEKTIALTRWTFVVKVISLLFNMLSRFVIAVLPGSKCLLISWLQSPSVVILEPKKIKSVILSVSSRSIFHEVMELDALILVFWILDCKVKWALGSITTNKATEVMEFQLSYFKSWTMMLLKCYTQYASKFGKFSNGHRTGKGQFLFQFQRKAMPKNVQTTI